MSSAGPFGTFAGEGFSFPLLPFFSPSFPPLLPFFSPSSPPLLPFFSPFFPLLLPLFPPFSPFFSPSSPPFFLSFLPNPLPSHLPTLMPSSQHRLREDFAKPRCIKIKIWTPKQHHFYFPRSLPNFAVPFHATTGSALLPTNTLGSAEPHGAAVEVETLCCCLERICLLPLFAFLSVFGIRRF